MIFSQFSIYNIIVSKMLCLRALPRTPLVGLRALQNPSWETLGRTLAEGPRELRAPRPDDPPLEREGGGRERDGRGNAAWYRPFALLIGPLYIIKTSIVQNIEAIYKVTRS